MKNLLHQLFALVTFILFTTSISKAQIYVGGLDQYMDYANISRNSAGPNNKYSDMAGTPFLNDDFETGKVKLRNGKTYEGPLRYDIYSDQIEFQTTDGNVYEIRNPETVEKITIGDQNFLCFFKEEGRKLEGIYEELVNGDLTLLAKHRVYLKDAVPAKPYIEARPATFIKKKSEYIIVDTEGDVIPVKNKKDVLGLEGGSGDIKAYIKKNKIQVSNEKDLVALIAYLNEN